MDKPIMLIRKETIEKLANVINESGLPAFIIEPILKDFLSETKIAMQKQFEVEKSQYEESLKRKDNKDYENL